MLGEAARRSTRTESLDLAPQGFVDGHRRCVDVGDELAGQHAPTSTAVTAGWRMANCRAAAGSGVLGFAQRLQRLGTAIKATGTSS